MKGVHGKFLQSSRNTPRKAILFLNPGLTVRWELVGSVGRLSTPAQIGSVLLGFVHINRHVAQLDEHRSPKAKDAGSSPAVTTIYGVSGSGLPAGFEYQCNVKALTDRHCDTPPFTDDKLYGSTAPLGKRSGGKPLGIKTSVIRQYGVVIAQVRDPASNTGGTGNRMGIRTSLLRQVFSQARMYCSDAREIESPAQF